MISLRRALAAGRNISTIRNLLKEALPETVLLEEIDILAGGRDEAVSTQACRETGLGGSSILELIQLIKDGRSEKPQVDEINETKAE